MRLSKKQKRERWLAIGFALLTLGCMVFFLSALLGTYREYEHFQERERRIAADLEQARHDFASREAYFYRLLNDPEFLERVARERLGYARPDELVFRFAD
jgi:cell division protein DivIC